VDFAKKSGIYINNTPHTGEVENYTEILRLNAMFLDAPKNLGFRIIDNRNVNDSLILWNFGMIILDYTTVLSDKCILNGSIADWELVLEEMNDRLHNGEIDLFIDEVNRLYLEWKDLKGEW
jgi:hypothetical protein